MKNPILPNLFDQHKALTKELYPIDMQLIKRLDYIFKTVANVCGFTFDDWCETTAAAHDWGDIWGLIRNQIIDTSKVHFYGLVNKPDCEYNIFIKNRKVNVRHNLPKEWLFRNFEQELKEGSWLFKTKYAILINNAKTKLSVEEMKALGIK